MKKKQFAGSQSTRREVRYFSEEFRKARVRELDEGQTTVAKICQDYSVTSPAVYKWREKYSPFYQKQVVKVVELESEGAKRRELEGQVSTLKTLLADKQIEVEYLVKLLEMLGEHYGIDFKKNSGSNRLNGFSDIGKCFSKKG